MASSSVRWDSRRKRKITPPISSMSETNKKNRRIMVFSRSMAIQGLNSKREEQMVHLSVIIIFSY